MQVGVAKQRVLLKRQDRRAAEAKSRPAIFFERFLDRFKK